MQLESSVHATVAPQLNSNSLGERSEEAFATIGLWLAVAIVVVWAPIAFRESRRAPLHGDDYSTLEDGGFIPDLPADAAQSNLMAQADGVDAPPSHHSH